MHLNAKAKSLMVVSELFADDPFYQKYLGHQAKTLFVLRCLPDELRKDGGLDLWVRQVERFLSVGCCVTGENRANLVTIERFQVAKMSYAVRLMLDPNLMDLLPYL